MIGGVCAGIAYWLGCPAWMVRLIWVIAIFTFGAGTGIYILLWILVEKTEKTPIDYDKRTC